MDLDRADAGNVSTTDREPVATENAKVRPGDGGMPARRVPESVSCLLSPNRLQ